MMKKLCLLMVLALGMNLFPAGAQDTPETVAAEEASGLPVVAQILSEAKFLSKKKPNLKARYFIFLRSTSWCVPCHMICPQLLKDYSKMKSSKAELILLGQEEEATVRQYMKEHGFKCPGVLGAELGEIPGFDLSGFASPALCIVTADGRFVGKLGGTNMYTWRKMLKAYQAEEARKKRAEKQSSRPE